MSYDQTNVRRARSARFAGLTCALFVLSSCATIDSDESLLRSAFDQIKNNRWEDYSKLTITSADFELKRNNINSFKGGLTYAGEVLKPELQKEQQQQFARATASGVGQIDFKNDQFDGIATTKTDELELIGGDSIPCRIVSIKLKEGAATSDSDKLQPLFLLVTWNGKPRILKLLYAD